MLSRKFRSAKLGIYYILGLDQSGRRVEPAEKPEEKEVSGQTVQHICMNALIQVALIVAFVFQCHHETFPKMVSPPPYPGLGQPGLIDSLNFIVVVMCNQKNNRRASC